MKTIVKKRVNDLSLLKGDKKRTEEYRRKDTGFGWRNQDNFGFEIKKIDDGSKLEYFPGSLPETTDNHGNIHNQMMIYNPGENIEDNDFRIPNDSIYKQLQGKHFEDAKEDNFKEPKALICITSYQEEWPKVLQTICGCIRNIFEMHAFCLSTGLEDYNADNFAIVLMQDGIDKLSLPFEKELIENNLFDPEMCKHIVAKTEHYKQVKKNFTKTKTTLISSRELEEENKNRDSGEELERRFYDYATTNILHTFATKINGKRLKLMIENCKNDEGEGLDLHQSLGEGKTPYDFCIDPLQNKENIPEIRFFFAAKHENTGKVESHMMFFKGFCDPMNPRYCQLINAGVVPKPRSISHFIKYLDSFLNCGGVSGEQEVYNPGYNNLKHDWWRITKRIEVKNLNQALDLEIEENQEYEGNELSKDERELRRKLKEYKQKIDKNQYVKISDFEWYGKYTRNFYHILEAYIITLAQYIEYKIDFYLNKSFESTFGFASILPSAFCMIRWEALKGEPLKELYKNSKSGNNTAQQAILSVAQDRVLCFEILKKQSSNYSLRYLPGAKALTDCPESIIGLIDQRRRWINTNMSGSWYIISNLGMISRSKHGCCRKFIYGALYFNMLYDLLFNLVLVGSLYAAFTTFSKRMFDRDDETCNDLTLSRIFDVIYIVLAYSFCSMSLTKPIERSTYTYSILTIILCSLVAAGFGIGLIFMVQDDINIYSLSIVGFALICYFVLPFIPHLCDFNWIKYILAVPILLFLTPLYVSVMTIFAFSNTQEVSWGKRATTENISDETKKSLEQFRAGFLMLWILSNTAYSYGTLYLDQDQRNYYILVISLLFSIPIIVKAFFALFYYCIYYPCYIRCVINGLVSRRKNSE
ncbi:unnamed protein product [Moneuplotes crassus]|uniref:chitin synthase n=1 Tax=Euplotes crassus TaxID=5936 RepID=A0AAD1XUC4_EUPCR|nr:unnamed protein product [Moneuplotes crassus]